MRKEYRHSIKQNHETTVEENKKERKGKKGSTI